MPVNGSNGITPALAAVGLLARTRTDMRKQDWPYAWQFPTHQSENFGLETVIGAPANGVQTELWSWVVPDGEYFRPTGIMLTYVGTPLVDGLGIVSWQWDVNIPTVIGGGVTAPILPSGHIVPLFGGVDANGNTTGQIVIHKGNPDIGPWPLPGRLVFEPRDVIRVKVLTAAPFPEVGVQFLTSLVGWTWPAGD